MDDARPLVDRATRSWLPKAMMIGLIGLGLASAAAFGAYVQKRLTPTGEDSAGLMEQYRTKMAACVELRGRAFRECDAEALELRQAATGTSAAHARVDTVQEETTQQHAVGVAGRPAYCGPATTALMKRVLSICTHGVCDIGAVPRVLGPTEHRQLLARLPHLFLFFPTGQSRVTAKHRAQLRGFLDMRNLRSLVKAGKVKFVVLSRSSITGNRDSNEILSQNRAAHTDTLVRSEAGIQTGHGVFSAYLGQEGNQITTEDVRRYNIRLADRRSLVAINQSSQIFAYGCGDI